MFIKRLIRKIAPKIYPIVFKLMTKLPQQPHRVMFESFHGKQFSDNPRAIYEKLTNDYPTFECIWAIDRRKKGLLNDKRFRQVKRLSFKWLYLMATSKYWVTNTRLPLWLNKPEQTIYLQTWHGTPLKRLGVDIDDVRMPGTTTSRYQKNFLKDVSQWDYLISPNRHATACFRSAFLYEGEMLETGYPRNDYLTTHNNEAVITQIKTSLNLPLDKQVILYAPTWRDDSAFQKGQYKFDLALDLDLCKAQLEEEYVLLIRAHYLVSEHLDLAGYENFVYDVSLYEDIRDLYLISDQLVTDYSSVFFDYAILYRPIHLFVYDLAHYRDQLRGFYLDIEKDLPFPIVETTTALINEIKHHTDQHGLSKGNVNPYSDAFKEQFLACEDGQATDRVIKRVFMNNHK